MTRKLAQQVSSLSHVAGPGGWRWVLLNDVADAIGMSAPELLTRFVDTGPSLGLWTDDGAYLVLVPSPDEISIEFPSDGGEVEIGYDEIDKFLEMVGPVRVPLGWALEVARLIEQGCAMTTTVEYMNYDYDAIPDNDMLWIRALDLAAGHYRVGYAARAPRGGDDSLRIE